MKLSWTETGHQGIVNFSLSLSSSLLLLYSQTHLLSTRLVGNFQSVSQYTCLFSDGIAICVRRIMSLLAL